MKTVKTKSQKPRFEFITVSAVGQEIGGVLVDNLNADQTHAMPRILTEFGYMRTADLERAIKRAVLAVEPHDPAFEDLNRAEHYRKIEVTGTLANQWEYIKRNIAENEEVAWSKASEAGDLIKQFAKED